MVGKSLLVIDDEPDFAKHIGRAANELGYDATVTTGAQQFKNAYDEIDPEVIVLDVIMPEVDGIELVNWLASRHCRAKLIIITGFTPCYAELARILGAAKGIPMPTTLFKPIGLTDLRAALA